METCDRLVRQRQPVGAASDTKSMATRLTRTELLRWRLRCQQLTNRSGSATTAQDVVSRLFGVQGQDLPGVLWSLGLRADGATQGDVRQAFDQGDLVRTWPFRGTFHVLDARDLGWVLDLTGERILRSEANLRRGLGLDAHMLAGGRGAIRQRLSGGRAATRDELTGTVEDAGITMQRRQAAHLVRQLAIEGTIVLGPFDGAGQLFVLADEWITAPRRYEPDAALKELATRYLAGHGPASERDLATWSKLPLGFVRTGLDAARSELTAFDYGDTRMWAHTATLDAVAADEPAQVLALPGFDELLLGYGDRTASLAAEHAPAIVPGGNGVFKPTVISRGRVVGVWKRKTLTGKTIVTATPLDGDFPNTVVTGLERRLRGYGRYLGMPVELTLDGE